MKLYLVHYGTETPYKHVYATTWKETAQFIKRMLDHGVPVHSVSVEHPDSGEEDDEYNS